MSDTTPEAKEKHSGAQQGQEQPLAQLRIVSQYVRDLSFENPGAPLNLSDFSKKNPRIDVQINVNGSRLSETDYSIDLKIDVTAKAGEDKGETDAPDAGKTAAGDDKADTFFVVELVYGGLFRLVNIPETATQQVLMVECPRHLFPYARRVLADAIRDGGFPPVMLDPVDFGQLYDTRLKKEAAQAPDKAHVNGANQA